MSKYSIESNPSRKMLEDISSEDHLFTSKHIENIRSILSKQIGNVSTIKDENIKKEKKNSINIKLDLDKSSKDEQNQIMSYLNLMHLMPMGMNPYNYSLMDPNIHGTPMFMLH